MGNNKFKLSDMIPNAWFYKLKDMSKAKRRNNANAMKNNKVSSPTTSQRSRYSSTHYFFNEPSRAGKLYNSPNIHTKNLEIPFIESPRRSSKRRSRRKTIYKPSPTVLSSSASANFISHPTITRIKPNQVESSDDYASSIGSSSESEFHEYVTSESESDSLALPDVLNGLATNCSCRVSSSTNDIIIDMNNESFRGDLEKLDEFDTLSELDLPPILTKPVKFDYNNVIDANDLKVNQSLPVKVSKEERRIQRDRKPNPGARKSSSNSTGIRLRVNSPKLASRKVQAYARRSVSSKSSRNSTSGYPEGFAVVKSSIDPQRDFRESMVEMIIENNIRASKDLEDLLACYLSLNSSEYHDLIVKAFEQIWFDMAQFRM